MGRVHPYVSCVSVELYFLALSVCRIGQQPVMGMLDRNFEPSVTGSEMWSCTWSNKRVKSCYRARARLHTDQDDLRRGQPVVREEALSCGGGGAGGCESDE